MTVGLMEQGLEAEDSIRFVAELDDQELCELLNQLAEKAQPDGFKGQLYGLAMVEASGRYIEQTLNH